MYKFSKTSNKYIVSIDNHLELCQTLKQFCIDQNILAGTIYGIGAVNNTTLRFLNPNTKQYVDKTFNEQMEICNLIGNISQKDGQVYLHIHLTLGRQDYTCIGGHMLTATINGACEIVIEKLNTYIGRYADDQTGLNLYKFEQ